MTLGWLLREYGGQLLARYPQNERVQRSLRLLAACRTRALGGHVSLCDHCGVVEHHYHSCGDRHCPQCGGIKRARWLVQRQAELLEVPYFHVVFTLPHELSALILGNRKLLYGLLFSSAAQTLLQLGADPKHLCARLGAIAVLHTWGQQLEHHPHVHMIVPGGGLACDDRGDIAEPWRWRSCRPKFLLSVKVLGKLFRGKYLDGLRQAYDNGQLHFAGSATSLADRAAFATLLDTLYRKDWNVFVKKPFAGPTALLKYLTRYTHRVALSNDRLVRMSGDHVTLTYKDYAHGCSRRELILPAVELFALHVIPGIVRIRHYGLLTHRQRRERLAKCRALLATSRGTVAAEPAPSLPNASLPNAIPVLPTTTPTSIAPLPATMSATPCATAFSVPSPTTATPTSVTELTTTVEVCRVCRKGKLETVWRGLRPHGRDFERAWYWDTS